MITLTVLLWALPRGLSARWRRPARYQARHRAGCAVRVTADTGVVPYAPVDGKPPWDLALRSWPELRWPCELSARVPDDTVPGFTVPRFMTAGGAA